MRGRGAAVTAEEFAVGVYEEDGVYSVACGAGEDCWDGAGADHGE